MIIGLIGPVSQDTESVVEMLTIDKEIQVVDSIELLRLADRKTMSSLTTQDYHKKFFLKKLEDEFGTVIITGNIILSEEILPWLIQEGGIIVVVSRAKMSNYDKEILESTQKYWDEKATQKYNLEVRFKRTYERLSKDNEGTENLYLIDISDNNSDSLNSLIGSSEDWSESVKNVCGSEELLKIVTVSKEDNMSTLEESIKKAMRDLGMEVDEEVEETEETEEKPTPAPKPKKEPKPSPTKPKKQPKEDFINPPEPEEETEKIEENSEDIDSIFVKITGNTMALLLPVGLKLEKQTIGDMEFNVATVSVPNVKNDKLQELDIKVGTQQKSKPAPIRKPITTEKSEKSLPKQPIKTVVVSGNLKDLQEEKSRLDGEIKKYRQAGDMDTVNSLRKQRRAVRNKINSLK